MQASEREIFIDLGEPVDPEDLPGERSGLARGSRRWLVLLCVVALLGTLTAAVPVPVLPWRSPVVLTVGPGVSPRTVVAGDLLLTVNPADPQVVAAWDLRAGERRWSLDRDVMQIQTATAVGDVIVFSGYPSTLAKAGSSGVMTYAVDAATGAARWEHPGYAYPVDFAEDGLLLLDGDSAAAVVDAATGAFRWRYGTRAVQLFFAQPTIGTKLRPTEALTMDTAGHLSSLSLRDGSLSPIGRLTPGAPIMGVDADTVAVELGRDLDGDPANGDEESSVVTYDRSTLRELWRVANRTSRGGHPVGRCGQWMCSLDGSAGRALHPRTGEVAWTTEAFPHAAWSRSGGDLLLATRPKSGETVLLDPANGRERLRFERWRWSGELSDGLLLLLPPSTGGQIWLGTVTTTGPLAIRPLFAFGPADLRMDDCTVSPGWIVCLTGVRAVAIDLRAAERALTART